MRQQKVSMIALACLALAVGCAGTGGRSSGDSGDGKEVAKLPPDLWDAQSHIRDDGSVSPTPLPEDPAEQPQPGQELTAQDILESAPTAGVDERVLREFQLSILRMYQPPGIELPDGAGTCNINRTILYFRKGDRNPFGMVAQDPVTKELYWPELIAMNCVGTEREMEVNRLEICYPPDSTYRKRWNIPVEVKNLRTDLEGIEVNGRRLYGAGKWYIVGVPLQLSDEMRGLVRNYDTGELMLGADGQPLRDFRHPGFYFAPDNVYLTPDSFSTMSEATAGTARGSDMQFGISERRDGCLFGLAHIGGESEGPDRVVVRVEN